MACQHTNLEINIEGCCCLQAEEISVCLKAVTEMFLVSFKQDCNLGSVMQTGMDPIMTVLSWNMSMSMSMSTNTILTLEW